MARFILLKIGYACLKNVILVIIDNRFEDLPLLCYMNLYDAQNNRLCMLKNVMLVGFISTVRFEDLCNFCMAIYVKLRRLDSSFEYAILEMLNCSFEYAILGMQYSSSIGDAALSLL